MPAEFYHGRSKITIEKELLAIVWAVKHFRPYVYGTKFKIVIDHKPLIWLLNDPGSRLIRWKLKKNMITKSYIRLDVRTRTPMHCNVRRDAPRLEEERDVHAIKEDTENANIYTEEEKKQILY